MPQKLPHNPTPAGARAAKTAVQQVTITTQYQGQRLDNWLLTRLKGLPRTAVYRLLRKGEVRVNGGRRKAEYRLQTDDVVRIPPVHQAPAKAPDAVPKALQQDLSQRLLWDDSNYLVLDKPSGLAVHGGSGLNYGAIEALRQATGLGFLELAHRIDRDTSGCLLFAKNRQALQLAHHAFRQGQVRKRYVAFVAGNWPAKLTRVQLPLLRYVTKSGERRVRVASTGKPSLSVVEILDQAAGYTQLAVFPHSGRTHQIRVHCLANGHPLVGDQKYATDEQLDLWQRQGAGRLCLHAQRLRLQLGPTAMDVTAKIPDDMLACWSALTS